jgi:hypothetical protein
MIPHTLLLLGQVSYWYVYMLVASLRATFICFPVE